MRHRLLKAVAAVTALGLAFGMGVVLGARQGWLQPIVTVNVVNQTGQPLSQLRVTYTSTRASGTLELGTLKKGEQAPVRFHVSGEATYRISAMRADGIPLQTQETYVEPGYTVTEVLTS